MTNEEALKIAMMHDCSFGFWEHVKDSLEFIEELKCFINIMESDFDAEIICRKLLKHNLIYVNKYEYIL